MTDPRPETDDRHPADVVSGMVSHVLDAAATWPQWGQLAFHPDGSAFYADSVGMLGG